MVHQIATQEEFDQLLKEAGDKLVVVDYWATWCGPCKAIAPKYQAFADKYTDVLFYKVDVDENGAVAESQNVNAMPTFILYKNGEKVTEVIGANAAKLEEQINANK